MICWRRSNKSFCDMEQRLEEVSMKNIPKWSIGMLLGVVCLIIGFFGDQFVEIYRKAVMICLECIGIG